MQVQYQPDPNDPEVQAIAAFLRVLNALENIRSSINVAERGRTMTTVADMRGIGPAVAGRNHRRDAGSVQRRIGEDLDAGILSARARLLAGKVALEAAQEAEAPQAIVNLLIVALRNLRAARTDLADPASLPPSFRN